MTTTTTTNAFIDIGANLLDERFTCGSYRGSQRHAPDVNTVLRRARRAGVTRIVLTAGTLQESRRALELARQWNQQPQENEARVRCYSTVGVHPTRCQQIFETENANAEDILHELLTLCQDGQRDGTVCAIGEIGLDYDRLEFGSREIQQKYLRQQLRLARETQLPLFLHNRNVGYDLFDILHEHADDWRAAGGVVHSFDDSIKLATRFMTDLGLYIGLNGCSLKTHENLATVQQLPLHKILLETDSPYCDIRSTHAGYSYVRTKFATTAEKKYHDDCLVKGRNEPCQIVQVAEVVAGCRRMSLDELARACHENTLQLFGWTNDE